MSSKTYGTRSDAKKAALKAGVTSFDIVPVAGGRFMWMEVKGDDADEAAVVTAEPTWIGEAEANHDSAEDTIASLCVAAATAQQIAEADEDALASTRDAVMDAERLESETSVMFGLEVSSVAEAIGPSNDAQADGSEASVNGHPYLEETDQDAQEAVQDGPGDADDAEATDLPEAAGGHPSANSATPPEQLSMSPDQRAARLYAPGRRFCLCVEGDAFPQSSPEAWAMELAKRSQMPVVIRDAATHEPLLIVRPSSKKERREAAKAGREPTAPRPAKAEGAGPKITYPAPEGSADGRAHANAAICRREALRRGYAKDAIEIHEMKGGDRPRYWWHPKADATAQAA